jgi:hypothetical protein
VKLGVVRRALIALRDRPKALQLLLVGVNLLNLADFSVTLRVLDSGGREANPILRPLLVLSPIWAGIFKLVAVLAASLLVWENRRYRKALIAALCVVLVFAGLVAYDITVLAFLS